MRRACEVLITSHVKSGLRVPVASLAIPSSDRTFFGSASTGTFKRLKIAKFSKLVICGKNRESATSWARCGRAVKPKISAKRREMGEIIISYQCFDFKLAGMRMIQIIIAEKKAIAQAVRTPVHSKSPIESIVPSQARRRCQVLSFG